MRIFLIAFSLIAINGCGGGGVAEPVNAPPIFTDPGTLEIFEGDLQIGTLTATDPEGSSVTFSLSSGADTSLFTISGAGELAFQAAPDFETPLDVSQDNIYQVIVLASDGQRSVSRTITVSVLDNIEGRVVDAPLEGATVFIDFNDDGYQDSDEYSVLTDANGYFAIPQVSPEEPRDRKIIALDGTDTVSGVVLSNFLLAANLPADPADRTMITPLSHVLKPPGGVSSSEPQDQIWGALGLDSNRDILRTDFWLDALEGNEDAKAVQRVNQQIAIILQAYASANCGEEDCFVYDFGYILHSRLSDQATQSGIDLTDPELISQLFSQVVDGGLSPSEWSAIAETVAMVNALVGSDTLDPTGSISGSTIVGTFHSDVIASVIALKDDEIMVADFISQTTPQALFGSIPVASEDPDNDQDGLPDFFDPDDDNDTVRDNIDAFPFDPSETTDTDMDGIGNNADTDDDNDNVEDDADFYPLISLDGRLDTDNDGRPNNCDSDCELTGMTADADDDNDGVNDDRDDEPLDATLTPPTAVILLDTMAGNAPLRVSFNASSSLAGNPSDESDSITWIVWDTGDTQTNESGEVSSVTSDEAVFQYIYLAEGDYTVSLTIMNSDGYTHTVTTQLDIDAVGGNLTVSGIIDVPDFYFVDSDVNDSGATTVSNDDFATSQRVFNPSIISGYANLAGEGPNYDGAGNTFTNGDEYDVYFFSATQGDVINLISGDPTQGDLDILLYDSDGRLEDYSLGWNTLYESVTVPSSGGWYIEVEAYSGASTYLLEIGGSATLASHGWNSSVELASYELLARKSVVAPITPSTALLSSIGVEQIVSSQNANYRGPQLYKFNVDAMEMATLQSMNAGITVSDEHRAKLSTLRMAKKMGKMPEFKLVQPNFMYHPLLVPDDELYQSGDQWHYDKIRMPEAWDETVGTGTTVVAIIDTGIRQDHPDLSGSISSDSYDFISDIDNAGDGDGIDNDPNDPGDGTENPLCVDAEYSSSWHGTHVGGTVGATTNNTTGVAGINWDVELMDLRVLGCYGGSSYDIQQSILYAAGLANGSGLLPSQKADVINLSLGSPGYDSFTESVIADARDEGVIVIASSGNGAGSNYPGSVSYPASYEGVISVGATTQSDTRASFSTYNQFVDISAPGVGVWSTIGSRDGEIFGSGYAAYNGTSMAAPHVAGVVSLMRDIYPDMTPLQLDASIASELLNDDLGDPGYDNEYGYGRLDAFKAVETAEALANGLEVSFPPRLSLSTDTLNFGVSGTQAVVTAYNAGDGILNITSVESSSANVVVSGPSNSDGLGSYTITLDRGALGEGVYQETVQFVSDSNSRDLEIRYEVFPENIPTDPNAGRMQIVLYDVNSENIFEVSGGVDAVSGEYSFTLNDIPPAVYSFITGTDMDNDGEICGNGEACSVWPNAQEPDFLIVNQDYSGLLLTTEYQAEVTTISKNPASKSSASCSDEKSIVMQSLEPACILPLIREALKD